MAVTKKAKTAKKTVAKKAVRGAKASTTSVRTASRPTAKTKGTASASKKTSASKTVVKKPAIKLNDRQRDYLKKIADAGVTGYEAGPSYEQRTIDALVERKLVKRGPKDKTSGKHRFSLTKTGEKNLSTGSAPATT